MEEEAVLCNGSGGACVLQAYRLLVLSFLLGVFLAEIMLGCTGVLFALLVSGRVWCPIHFFNCSKEDDDLSFFVL
mgnify:CR=1 FL=1